mgnify:CR=1 FL=1
MDELRKRQKIISQLVEARLEQGISQAELARRLGKSPQSFNSKMKRESFTVKDLEKIADVLGVEFNREFILANGDKV